MMDIYILMDLLRCSLEQSEPFFVGRIAGVELQTAYALEHHQTSELPNHVHELENNAGIHVTSMDSLYAYTQQLIRAYDHCTAIAEWPEQGEVFAITGAAQRWIAKRTPTIPKLTALALEPYYATIDAESWMPAMKGKRVLVIHPFVATFEKQAKRLSHLFPGRSWFEDCTFQFMAPPQTLAGNHQGKDWQDHYSTFLIQLDQCSFEFDVALVAAGGYGMLIADHIYTVMHKSVIYIGGALQLFFGVIGRRWFTNHAIIQLVNDEWIRPLPSDQPPNARNVERGCYW